MSGNPHEFCDHTDECQCVQCASCRAGKCHFRCAANWRREQERDAERRHARCQGLLRDLAHSELPPDQIAILEAEGYGKAIERIRRERHGEAHRARRMAR